MRWPAGASPGSGGVAQSKIGRYHNVMSPGGTDFPQKYAWCEVLRTGPSKAPAGERIRTFSEIYSLFDEQSVREQASRCIQCPHPSCRTGCPLSNRIPEWLALVADGEFLEAAAISQATSNMPEICSRVCPQERLCESQCVLNSKSEPVCIGAIELFINEYAFAHQGIDVSRPEPNGRKVAVIGSGPGGLACADELARRGYAVTVFESQALPGGLLMGGIPAFKLEKSIVLRRIHVLEQRGVEGVSRHRRPAAQAVGCSRRGSGWRLSGLAIPHAKERERADRVPAHRGGRPAGGRARRRRHGDGLSPHRNPLRRAGIALFVSA